MRLPTGWGRITGGLVLLLAAISASFATPAAAQSGESSIEIHNRVCPPGYAGGNFYEDCHATPSEAGLPFTFASGATYERATNAEGNVGLANLPEGSYTITGVPPAELVDRVVYCAVGTAETSNQSPIDITYVNSGIQLYLPEDTNVICDWYNVPAGEQDAATETTTATETETVTETATETATATEAAETTNGSIEVHNRICLPESADRNAFDACHDNVPESEVPFTFAGPVTHEGVTNPEGDVGFANLPEGTYAITGNADGDRYVYCSVGTAETSNESPVAVEYIGGGIQIYLPADTNVICDWYSFPVDPQDEATSTEQVQDDGTSGAAPGTADVQADATETATETATADATTEVATEERINRAGLFGGSCDSLTNSILLTELQSLRPASQEETGVVESSETTVPVPIDELVNGENMAIVFYDDPSGDVAIPVACGQLVGEPDDTSSVVVDLQAMNNSDSAGTVTLTPAEEDPTQTKVLVTLGDIPAEGNTSATPAA